eukprot:TRINITY_DN17544_c0_g1_i1.p1 TRINITY_DN17544_c0_g1~~TRINITY_DN17544_c0_g1_i1.p1  ORF type:complete len:125 (-),score=37.01 TRINITY_DN17544_c0_g1_i1:279-653(-)
MHLLTHNLLQCIVQGCRTNSFPLRIIPEDVQEDERDFNQEFMVRMLPRIHWAALLSALENLSIQHELPAELPADASSNEELLQKLHRYLLEIRVQQGALICNGCGRKYDVRQSIPNMMLNEDEV